MAVKLAFYARYSCEQQRETSIEDQLRRCRDVASQLGLADEQALVFKDEALSGTSKHTDKRNGYRNLLAAWDKNEFTLLIVDEWSRLTRDAVEQAKLMRRLEDNRRVRLVTADGIDTNTTNWQLQVGLVGIISQQATRDTRHRVARGMLGQLERGYLVAAPAFGYAYKREFDDRDNRIGTRWLVDEQQAALVREIFAQRASGESMHQIAKWLNDMHVPCSRQASTPDGGFWRPSRIRNLLTNPIYRGEFHWHGSVTYRDKAKKMGMPVEVQVFKHPELRLVSDETWYRCNGKSGSRTGYGGGKHALSGIVTCGCCGGTLAISASKRAPSLYCPSCTVAKHMNGQNERLSATIAKSGVQYLLTEAIRLLFTPAFMDAFKTALRQRLTSNDTVALDEARAELARQSRAQDRLSHLLAQDDTEDATLEKRYAEARTRVRDLQARVEALEAGRTRIDPDVLERQLQIDPADVLVNPFESDIEPHKLRTVLGRLFPSIVFEGKERRYTALFTLRFAPGAALALASKTDTLVDEAVELHYRLQYSPRSHFAGDEQHWSVTRLEGETRGVEVGHSDRPSTSQPPACVA